MIYSYHQYGKAKNERGRASAWYRSCMEFGNMQLNRVWLIESITIMNEWGNVWMSPEPLFSNSYIWFMSLDASLRVKGIVQGSRTGLRARAPPKDARRSCGVGSLLSPHGVLACPSFPLHTDPLLVTASCDWHFASWWCHPSMSQQLLFSLSVIAKHFCCFTVNTAVKAQSDNPARFMLAARSCKLKPRRFRRNDSHQYAVFFEHHRMSYEKLLNTNTTLQQDGWTVSIDALLVLW
jgi:hypothetical protein